MPDLGCAQSAAASGPPVPRRTMNKEQSGARGTAERVGADDKGGREERPGARVSLNALLKQ